MVKTSTTSLLAILLFAVSIVQAKEIILTCKGFASQRGMDEPKNEQDKLMKPMAEDRQYIVGDRYLVEVDGQDGRLSLCESTAAQYRYSWNCQIKNKMQFALDWLQEKDISIRTSPFWNNKKYFPTPDSYIDGRFIVLDRINLRILDEIYSMHSNPKIENLNGEKVVDLHNFVIIDNYEARCKIAKPKI
jgi:hypothetical protein